MKAFLSFQTLPDIYQPHTCVCAQDPTALGTKWGTKSKMALLENHLGLYEVQDKDSGSQRNHKTRQSFKLKADVTKVRSKHGR